MSFFDTPQYLALKKLENRLREINTAKNRDNYKKVIDFCKKMAESDYNNIGYDEITKDYKWNKFDISKDAGEPVEEVMSAINGWKMYINNSWTHLVAKSDETGECTIYPEKELMMCKDLTIDELTKVNEIKYQFGGSILEQAERVADRSKNKEMVKRAR